MVAASKLRPDPFGRVLSRLEIDGRDAREIALDEGWGKAWRGPPEPRPSWCAM